MINKYYLPCSIVILIAFSSCNSKLKSSSKEWTAQRVTYVIQSNVYEDNGQSKSDSGQVNKNFLKMVNMFTKGIDNDIGQNGGMHSSNVLYALDTSISYEIKRWPNGSRSFDAIRINNQYNGWCVWYHQNGNKLKEGTMLNNVPVGNWYYFSESKKLDTIIDYGNSYKIYFELN